MQANHLLIVQIFALFATILSGCGGEAHYDPHQRNVIHQRTTEGVLGAALSPEGFYAVIGTSKGKYPMVWDLVQQKKLHELKDPFTKELYTYKFSRDSKYVAVVGENRASVWDVESGKKYGGFSIGDQITAVDVNVDGVYTLYGTLVGAVFYVHSASGKVMRQFINGAKIEHLALTPNGLSVITSDDRSLIKIWNVASGKVSQRIKIDKPISQVHVSNQVIFVSTSQGGMYLYSIVTGKLFHQLDYPNTSVSAAVISASNRYIVTANMPNRVNVWDIRSGDLVQSLEVRRLNSSTNGQRYVLAVAFNEEEKEIYIEDASGYGEILPVTKLMSHDEISAFKTKSYVNPEVLKQKKDPTDSKGHHSKR